MPMCFFFFFQAEDGIRDFHVTGVQTCALPISFGFEDFRSRAAAAGVDRAVLVQADDSAADTEAMFEVAAAHPEIVGVVAWVPLDRPDEAGAELDRLQARPG